MKYLSAILPALVVFQWCYGQDYKSEFTKSFQANDTVRQREILAEWDKADPRNPELYTSYFNYYFHKSRQELVLLSKEKPKGQSMSFQDSAGNVAGHIGQQVNFNREILQKGLGKIDAGITLFPDRLDMRFGKIYALGQVKDWENFTNEIIKTIQYSSQNKNEWTWTNNEKKANGESFFLNALQDYQVQLYNTGDDKLLDNMGSIAKEVLKFYPNHIESLSNLSLKYLVTGDYEKAIEILLKAEKIDPKDAIVLGNIAHGYKLKGDKGKAIEYYEKVTRCGDTEMIEFANDQIKELKKN